MLPALVPSPALTAQVDPPTVAYPPRIVCDPPAKLALAVVLVMPLVDDCAPAGSAISTVPPVLRVIALAVSRMVLLVALAFIVMVEPPWFTVRPPICCVLAVLALPV